MTRENTADRRVIADVLARAAPFSEAPPGDLEPLLTSAQLLRYASGAQIFLEGERSPATWVVASGRVRILTFLAASRTFQIEMFGPRQLFGVCCRIGGVSDRYLCTAVAAGDAAVVRLPDAVFLSLLRRSAGVARASCELCARRLNGMRRSVRDARLSVRPRLAKVLLNLRSAQGDEVRATRHALAAWVGAAPETVFRELADMRARGVLSTGRGTVRILDWRALAAEGEDNE